MEECDPIRCFCWCCPNYDTDNEQCPPRDGSPPDPIDISDYLNACPPTPPATSTIDSLLYPSHYLHTLHPIIVQPPPNCRGAHGIRQLTHDQRFILNSPLPPSSSPGPVIYVVSNGVLTSSELGPPRWHPGGERPGQATRTGQQSQSRAPPGYSHTPPSRGGAETAEPPPYREDLPEVPAYPGRGDGTMSAPTGQGRQRR